MPAWVKQTDMPTGRAKATLTVTDNEQTQLGSLDAPRTLPSALVARTKVGVVVSWGKAATRLPFACTGPRPAGGGNVLSTAAWRDCMTSCGGGPRSIDDEQIAALLKRTLSHKPEVATYWSIRQAARASRISKSTVHRLFQTLAVQPHRSCSSKLSTDPFFIEKVRDVVGLYLNPPDHALVLRVDEESQLQALNRGR